MPNHVRTLLDLGPEEILYVLGRADQLKQLRGKPAHPQALLGKSVAVVFEKASTRTRISFDVGIKELGGHPVVLFSRDTQIDRGESVEDTAHMLSGYVHAIVYRTFGHDRIERMAATASVPVINALSDKFHPCQVLADLMTIRECNGGHLEGVRVAWVGDGNNMANSWIYAAALTGLDLVLACPEGYDPAPDVVAYAKQAKKGKVTIVRDVAEAVRAADVVTTDVWTSMGQEAETEARKRAFAGYLIDDAKMKTAKPSAIFLHCLPAHRGEEVAASVIDGAQSRVWQEAENRLHAQKALLEWVMEE